MIDIYVYILLLYSSTTSMSPDEIHPKLLKSLASDCDFVEAVTQLFTKCNSGVLPQVWKEASVVALFKNGKKNRSLKLSSSITYMYYM